MGSGAVTSNTGPRGVADSSISSIVVLGLKGSKGENFSGLQKQAQVRVKSFKVLLVALISGQKSKQYP